MTIHEAHLLISHESLKAVHLVAVGHIAVLETEAPRIDQRSHCDVERPIGVV